MRKALELFLIDKICIFILVDSTQSWAFYEIKKLKIVDFLKKKS